VPPYACFGAIAVRLEGVMGGDVFCPEIFCQPL